MKMKEALDDLNLWEELGETHPDYDPNVGIPTKQAIESVRKILNAGAIPLNAPGLGLYHYGPTWFAGVGYYIEYNTQDRSIIFRVNAFGVAHCTIWDGTKRLVKINYEYEV